MNQEIKLEDQISQITKCLKKQSINSSRNTTVFELLSLLGPFLKDLKQFQNSIKQEDTMIIYKKYHSYIMQLENANSEATEMTKQSANAILYPQKFNQIKKRVMNMMKKLQTLQKEVIDKNQMVLLWIDKNQKNNKELLTLFQKNYKGKLLIKYFIDYEAFKIDLLKHQNSPLIIIMSAVAAGPNIQYGDADIFNFLKQYQKDLRIKGTVIFCGDAGYENLKYLKNDPSHLLTCLTTKYNEIHETVKKLIIPIVFNKIVPIEHLDYFIPNLKNKFISKNMQDWRDYSLINYHPQSVNYEEMFQKGYNLILKDEIQFDPQIGKTILNIPKEIEKVFESTRDCTKLSELLVNMYSKEDISIPVYQCINSILSFMNEDLLAIMEQFIDLFFIAFYQYDDSQETEIQPNGNITILYRGSSITAEQLEEQFKENSYVVLPSFSSFTSDKSTAEFFIAKNTIEGANVSVMFEFQYSTGTQGFTKRPKMISRVTKFKKENEYVVYPFSCLKISKVNPPDDQNDSFLKYFTIKMQIK